MTQIKNSSAPRKSGRPNADQAKKVLAREALLAAARELFGKLGFDATTTKMIAQHAQVNPALIHYYFGGKAGLNEAMLREALQPLLDRVKAFESSEIPDLSLSEFFGMYMRTLAENPWLPKLMVREVLPDNGRLREIFISEFASRTARMIPLLIRRDQAAGRLQSNLDPVLTTLSFASMAVFPFLAAPIIEPALGIRIDQQLIELLIPHTADIFYHGTATGARECNTRAR